MRLQSPHLAPHRSNLIARGGALAQPRHCIQLRRRSLRCFSSGKSEQDGFNLLNWGANLIKRIGSSPRQRSEPVQEPTELQARPVALANVAQRSGNRAEAASRTEDPEAASEAVTKSDPEVESLEERRRLYRHLSRLGEITAEWPPADTLTWEDWLREFDSALLADNDLTDLHSQLAEATEKEDYKTAAAVKKELDSFAENDELTNILGGYADAVQRQDYESAADLRDYGGVGLLGWWWPESSTAGVSNHLLRVVPANNRYLFVAYDASDLAAVHGVLPKDMSDSQSYEPGYIPEPSQEDFNEHGVPIAELLYRRFEDESASGTSTLETSNLVVQACALRFTDGSWDLQEEGGVVKVENEASSSDAETSGDEEESAEIIKMEGLELSGLTDNSIPIISLSLENQDESSDDEITVESLSKMANRFPAVRALFDRLPASIQKFENDRDRFLVHVFPTEEEEAAARAEAEAEPGSRESDDERPEFEVIRVSDDPEKQAMLDKLVDRAKDLGVDLKQTVSLQVKVKGDLKGAKKLDFRLLAEELVKGNGTVWESGDVAEALSNALEKVSRARSNQLGTGFMQGSVSYKRLPFDRQRTDPFTGIFVGMYGTHGPEVVQLRRCIGEDGKEYCEATKLIGDENVPSGQVTFRAAIGLQSRMTAQSHFPPDWNISARYKGKGRVAEPGYENASWVDGELVVFGGSTNELVQNAHIGFLWRVGGAGWHLSAFTRLTLDDSMDEILALAEEDNDT